MHANEAARLGGHVSVQVDWGLRESEPRLAAGNAAVSGPESALTLSRRENLEDPRAVGVDIGGQGD